ncbi:HipA domain-containing protein [Adlercreutzia sp. R7]|uniref:HipA domain-containing protein n=1 Tax=Adlercreutzia wanghongyangiae TaxID=3111451 RepID=A0ABU6IKJ8_9ACTN|nr:HipA domain-containing protein [Adlercreutzia sp. R7]
MTSATEKHLEVFLADSHAGQLIMSRHGELSFVYDSTYRGPDLSLAMPFSTEEYRGKRVLAWFDNLLPDNTQVRQGMADEAGSSTGVFPLLARFGLDLPGAVQVVDPDELPSLLGLPRAYVQLTPEQVGERLCKLVEDEDRQRARAWTQSEEHWSLGGMQSKIALRRFNDSWYECVGASASNIIVKPGAWGLEGQAIVEFITMRLAKRCGLPCASVALTKFGAMDAIVIDRYDRYTAPDSGNVTRIHQEDLCQATGTMPGGKYAADGGPSSIELIELLKGTEGNSLGRFIDALLFNYLTASTDAHAKNYSLLHPAQGRSLLAPLYDVASAAPFMKKGKTYRLAMSIGGENRVGWLRKSSIERFAATHSLDVASLANRTEELATLARKNLPLAVEDAGPQKGIERIAETLIPRIDALCSAAQRNIRTDSKHFKPVDITRFGF